MAVTALFYITVAEALQDKPVYEDYKWQICGGVLGTGAVLFASGLWLNRRIRTRYRAAQASLPEAERDLDPGGGEPFMLFNLSYWGIMFAIFSAIIVVIVPKPRVTDVPKVEVAARTNRPAPAIPTNRPTLKLQGLTVRGSTRSALINGRTYFVGDWVGEAQLLSIDPEKAVLSWHGTQLVLPAPD